MCASTSLTYFLGSSRGTQAPRPSVIICVITTLACFLSSSRGNKASRPPVKICASTSLACFSSSPRGTQALQPRTRLHVQGCAHKMARPKSHKVKMAGFPCHYIIYYLRCNPRFYKSNSLSLPNLSTASSSTSVPLAKWNLIR